MVQSPDRRRGPRTSEVASQSARASMRAVTSALHDARIAAGLTQEQLANLAGLSQVTVSAVERRDGDYGRTELRTARALAAALGTTVDALFPPKGGAQ